MRISVRLWQTALFVTVILVAMLILGTTLYSALERSILALSRDQLSQDADALALTLRPRFPLTRDTRQVLRDEVRDYVDVFGDDVWVFDARGSLIDQVQTRSRPAELLRAAAETAYGRGERFTHVEYGRRNLALASSPIVDANGQVVGAVVVADQGAEALAILNAARDQLMVTFWAALAISGLLGYVFSEIITRQVRQLSDAAEAIAEGDFGRRLRRSRLPDEIAELADSYNRMAVQLGHAFAALKGQEREIAAVVESMGEGVVAVDGERVVRHANPVAARLLGVTLEGLIGSRIDDTTSSREVLGPIEDALAGRHVSETVEVRGRFLLLHGTPLAAPDDGSGAVMLIRDITEQKRWEDAQRQFVANASHELRTPIAALKGFIELLEGGAKAKPEVRDEFLQTMQAEVDRLQRLVGDLFALAQLDSGTIRLDLGQQSLEEIVGDVVAVMGPLAEAAGVDLDLDLPTPAPAVIADRDRIVQVLIGFVDNAFKYGRTGDRVTVYARPQGALLRVGVADTGQGIEPEALDKIFERFYRAGDEQDARPRGAGLGLAIAKEIVEAHGSSIGVRSELGAGSEFWFMLRPAREPQAKTRPDAA